MIPKCFPLLKGGEGYTRVAIGDRWDKWAILEYPPAFRWLRIWSCPFPLPFVLPYVYFFIRIDEWDDVCTFKELHVYFAREPITSVYSTLYVPFLPHFTAKENLCNGKLVAEGTERLHVAVEIVNRFWNQGFGILHLRWRSVIQQADWRVYNPYRWALFSLLNPEAVLELEMLRFGNVRDLGNYTSLDPERVPEQLRKVLDGN